MTVNLRLVIVVLTALLCVLSGQVHSHAAPVILFDQSHDQRFVIEKDEPLHLYSLAAIMKGEGADVKSSKEPLSDALLANVNALVISGPFQPLTAQEVEAVLRFIERGGRAVFMLHIGMPFAELLHKLEVDFTNLPLFEQENIIDGNSKNFQVKSLEAGELFSSMDHFSAYGVWALMNTAPTARIVASTSPKAWVDLNGDGKLSRGDVMQQFGVAIMGEYGAGRFVVFGDDAIFQNRFLDEGNTKLAKNLARWLK